MNNEEKLSEKESLALITSMIQKAKNSYHDSGTASLLWGSAVTVASFVTYLQLQFDFEIGFDIWLIVFAAFIPQIFISIRQRKTRQFQSHTDTAINAVWLTYTLTIFGLSLYQNIVPGVTNELIKAEGWNMMKHYNDVSKPDELLKPFTPSLYSIYILIYAIPTLVTGIVKKFKPMIIGSVIAYVLFVCSCFTAVKYDMLFGAIAALACWFVPGLILRNRYNRQKGVHV
ncbi:MAG: hypothetical protein V4717_02640 [Bacteroidota bacterium]